MSTLKRFFKDTIIYGVAAVLPRAITILLVKLKTKVFEAETYAVDIKYYVYAAYFNILLTYGLETAFFRFFTKEKEKGKVVSTAFISLLSSTLLFLGISLFFADQLSAFFGFSDAMYFKLLIATLVLDTLVVIPYAYLRVTNKPINFTFFKVSNVIISAILVVFFLWFVPKYQITLPEFLVSKFGVAPKVIYIFLAGVVASLFTFIVMLPILFKFRFTFDKAIFKKLLFYGLPIMIGGLAYVTNENLDKLLMPKYLDDEQMGIYGACYKLGVFMTLFIMAFRLGAEPYFFNQADKKDAKTSYAKILHWFTIVGALFMFIIVAYIDLFSKIIIGQESYLAALKIVPIILLANLFLGIYNNLSIWYKLTDKTKYGMYISGFGAIITIVLNVLLLKQYGYMVSAWTTLIVYSSMTVISYYLGRKHYPVNYNIKKIGLYLLVGTVLSCISFIKFRGNYILSTFLLLIFIGLIYRREKEELNNILAKS